jgi:DNA modification methylase
VTTAASPAHLIQGNALALPLADASVDLVVTSPPYFGLRSYKDGGEHYVGQIGAEATPGEFVDALVAATREMVRVLKPAGSIFVNLGDKYSMRDGQGGPQGPTGLRGTRRQAATYVRQSGREFGAPLKSLVGIPWRYALRCIDDLGLILRAEILWSKPNGLPESVTDRVRRSHETWFHFVKQPRYYSAVDEIREAHIGGAHPGLETRHERSGGVLAPTRSNVTVNPLGKLPGSVWEIPTQPLNIPDHIAHSRCCNGRKRAGCEDGIDHYAAFPMEWPRRIIRGWSPNGVCTACSEERRPVPARYQVDRSRPQARRALALVEQHGLTDDHIAAVRSVGVSDTGRGAATQSGTGKNTSEVYALAEVARAALGGYAREFLLQRPTGLDYACSCSEPTAPTRPAVVLDPFGGTGTTALVAKVLGRTGISVDMSADYGNVVARWRVDDPDQIAAAMQIPRNKTRDAGTDQLDMFGESA